MDNDDVQADAELFRMWAAINEQAYAGKLPTPNGVLWATLSGDDGIGAHGVYYPQHNIILIDLKFQPDWELVRNQDQQEVIKASIAFRLLVHETVHQFLHENGLNNPGKHGAEFANAANNIYKALEVEAPPTSKLERWPSIIELVSALQ